MNRNEMRLKLARLDKERDMVLNYLKYTENHFAKTIYENTLEYLNSQTDLVLEMIENYKEERYEH